MADVNPRHRVFCWVFDLMGWLRVQDMSPASLRRHRKPFSPPWAAHLVQGKVPEDVTFRDETIEGPNGAPLRLRVYTPDGVPLQDRPLVINLHGGGWVLANVEMTEWMCGQLAGRLGAVVVSVDYRLAPEHPAPAAYDDCWHAVGHLLQHASEYGIDPNRWAAFGDSAGGNLSALLAIGHRDAVRAATADRDLAALARVGTMRVQGLIYPVTDLTCATPSYERHAEAPVLTRAAMLAFRRHYLGSLASPAPDDPAVSPHFCTDLTGLPPAIVTIAERDPLCDEALIYADQLRRAGTTVEVDLHEGVPHGFTTMPGTSSAAGPAADRIVTFFRRHL